MEMVEPSPDTPEGSFRESSREAILIGYPMDGLSLLVVAHTSNPRIVW